MGTVVFTISSGFFSKWRQNVLEMTPDIISTY